MFFCYVYSLKFPSFKFRINTKVIFCLSKIVAADDEDKESKLGQMSLCLCGFISGRLQFLESKTNTKTLEGGQTFFQAKRRFFRCG